ncbi:MAG: Eco57I restriction-modification methylase domain-containing protein [Vicinamibacterales bacterium]
MHGDLVSEHYAGVILREAFEGMLGEETAAAARHRFARLWLAAEAALGPASSVRSVFDRSAAPLADLLGFTVSDFAPGNSGREIVARLRGPSASVALVACAWGENLDGVRLEAVRYAAAIDASWALCCNGQRLRLVDARRSYRRSFLEFDLRVAAGDEPGFAVLWALLRADAFEPAAGASTSPRAVAQTRPGHAELIGEQGFMHGVLDERPRSLVDRVVEASAIHARRVCAGLRNGVVQALVELVGGVVSARRGGGRREGPALPAVYTESLVLVYRILFLLFAESRGLVPLWHPVYRESYSIEALREAAELPGRHTGVWETLLAISRLAHAGCNAGTLRVTPFNGRLFAPARTALAEASDLDDEAASRALVALSTDRRAKGARPVRVDYRDLGVEQLGAVYETVLDYDPVLAGGDGCKTPADRGRRAGGEPCAGTEARADAATRAPAVGLRGGSGRRKASGTFYTPSSVTDYLVRRTLHPLVTGRSPEEILGLRVLDPAMGSGAFLVAACRYLASAYESALVAAGKCNPGEIEETERASIRRAIAERCLFGVDVNPMAVELARLSIWLTTLAADRPLTFLDHHLVTGDSLAGASIDDLLRQPPGGARRRPAGTALPLFETAELDGDLREVIPARMRIGSEPADTIDAVREKERALAELDRPSARHARWKRALDLWCAVWFWPSGSTAPAARTFMALVDETLGRHRTLPSRTASHLLDRAAKVAASQRFFHWQLEFPEVFFDADGSEAPRAGFDAVLTNPPWDMLRANEGHTEGERGDCRALVRFVRESGVYRSQSTGHPNRFQLFVERAVRLAAPGGRLGMVVPWGLATDHGCAPLRRLLFDRCEVDALVGMENSEAIFPIHRSVRFALVTATRGRSTVRLRCRFGETSAQRLDSIPGDQSEARQFPVVVSRAVIRSFSGDDEAVPDLRGPEDLVLLEKILAACPPVSAENGWNVRFGRELNATDDRPHFVEAGEGIPIVGGKQLRPFAADLHASRFHLPARKASELVDAESTYLRPRLAYRDVASATNRLTLIAAILPAGCLTTHTVFCLKTPLDNEQQDLLCGLFNSFVANYLIRLRVVTHVTVNAIEHLPVPFPSTGDLVARKVAATSRELRRGPEGQAWNRRYARLQALVASMYGLSRAELEHVLASFPLVEDSVKRQVLGCFLDKAAGPRLDAGSVTRAATR